MTYLTGKRFEYLGEGNAAGTKTGVIVSEPFRSTWRNGVITSTCVAILWDDGSMEGAIDVELLKVTGDTEKEVILRDMRGNEKIIHSGLSLKLKNKE